MAKIIIDIQESVIEHIKDGSFGARTKDRVTLIDAVMNGTPLPKGHRRLITEPTEEDIAKTVGGQNDFADCIREAVKTVFTNAPTIIEAESEDEK